MMIYQFRRLNELFSNQTFFFDGNGLNLVEGCTSRPVVNTGSWGDAELTSLTPHEPEPTEIVVILESKH
jgi:hypothetical protein